MLARKRCVKTLELKKQWMQNGLACVEQAHTLKELGAKIVWKSGLKSRPDSQQKDKVFT